jgi:hypothetical protein
MKRFLIISIISIVIMTTGLLVVGSFRPAEVQQVMVIEWACKFGQCKADNENDNRCKRCVSNFGDIFCKKHRNSAILNKKENPPILSLRRVSDHIK